MRLLGLIAVFLPAMALCAPDTVAAWLFDEDSAGRVLDRGPSGLHGSASGVRYVEGPGGVGLALSFRGGGNVALPPAVYLADGSAGFAVSFWLRSPRATQARTIIAAGESPNAPPDLVLGLDSGGRLTLTRSSAPGETLVGRRRLDDGLWHYVAGAYYPDERSILLFVDDQIEARGASDGTLAGKTMAIRLGAALSGESAYGGDLDDLEITAGLSEDFENIIRIRERFVVLQPGQARRALAEYRAAAALGAFGADNGPQSVVLPSLANVTGPDEGAEVVSQLRDAVGRIVAGGRGIVPGRAEPGSGDFDIEEYRVEPMVITTEPEIPVPAVLLRLAPAADMEPSAGPAVILLDDVGKADAAGYHWRVITGLADAGIVVCLADPRGTGELAGAWHLPAGNAWAAGAYDIVSLARFLENRSDVIPGRVVCVAFGATALPALAAAVIEPGIARVVIVPGEAELTEACACSVEGGNVDLPTLIAGIAPRPVWLGGQVTDGDLGPAIGLYQAFGQSAGFLATADPPLPDDLVKWVRAGWE
ncbi:MAG: hypothetical protein HPY44_15070 [Armatimonadetes bacterium]|nr:hypothetical protein [Armatimonadota bacterium]